MRVLVTGHLGYLGSALVPMLTAAGHRVVGLDSGLFEPCFFGPPPLRIRSLHKDIRDIQAADLQAFDAIVHLAALSNDPLGNLDPQVTLEINHQATVRLARLASDTGVRRFLFSSTCSIYGAAGEDMVAEEAELHPVTPYGQSKARAEEDLRRLADAEFSLTFLRNATAYGLSPYVRFDLVLNNLVAWATATGAVHLKSDGSAWRPLVHVEDIARAFVAALGAPRRTVHNQAINVGQTAENYRIRDLAEIVRQTVPGSRIEFEDGARADTRCYRVDFGKLARLLPGWKPQWNAARGAQQLYQALRAAKIRVADFEGPRYMRIAHLQSLLEAGRLDATLRWKDNRSVR